MADALRRSVVFPREVVSAASMPLGAGIFAECAVAVAGIDESDRVVDVGCGPGTTSRAAAQRGAVVFGVDPTPIMLTFARWYTKEPLRARITWLEGLAEAIPLGDGEATAVIATRAAHHFDDPSAAFEEMRRVLSAGGRVVIVERAVRSRTRGRTRPWIHPGIREQHGGRARSVRFRSSGGGNTTFASERACRSERCSDVTDHDHDDQHAPRWPVSGRT